MVDHIPLSERVSTSFSELSTAAADLNAVTDELGKCVAQIDEALKRLNLGLTVWVPISHWNGNRYNVNAFGSQDLGYAKINGKWGISLREAEGDENDPDEPDVELWLFADAPRALRLSAIDKIPELLAKLSSSAAKAKTQIQDKLEDAQAVAAAINPLKPNGVVVKGIKSSPAASRIAAAMIAAEPKTGVVDTAVNVYLTPVEPFITSPNEVKK